MGSQRCGVTCSKVTQLVVWRTQLIPGFLTMLWAPVLRQSGTSRVINPISMLSLKYVHNSFHCEGLVTVSLSR